MSLELMPDRRMQCNLGLLYRRPRPERPSVPIVISDGRTDHWRKPDSVILMVDTPYAREVTGILARYIRRKPRKGLPRAFKAPDYGLAKLLRHSTGADFNTFFMFTDVLYNFRRQSLRERHNALWNVEKAARRIAVMYEVQRSIREGSKIGVGRTFELLRIIAESFNAEYSEIIPDSMRTGLEMDPVMVLHLCELAKNAAREQNHSNKSGNHICVSMGMGTDSYQLRVTDDGDGFPPSHENFQAAFFKEYSCVGSSGLGLTMLVEFFKTMRQPSAMIEVASRQMGQAGAIYQPLTDNYRMAGTFDDFGSQAVLPPGFPETGTSMLLVIPAQSGVITSV